MEWPLAQATGGPEAAAAGCDGLRLFTVAKATSLAPKDDVTGQWSRATRRRRPAFSAVAFFFGQELHRALGVKVGLVHSSWGGTPAEAWTSRDALAAEPSLRPLVADFDAALERPRRPARRSRRGSRRGRRPTTTRTSRTRASRRGWAEAATPTRRAGRGWTCRSRGRRPASRSTARCGSGAPSRSPPSGPGRTCASRSARSTTSTRRTSPARRSAAPARRRPATTPCPARYTVPGRLVKPGRTVVAVRVFDHYGGGGFSGAAPEMTLGPADGAGAPVSARRRRGSTGSSASSRRRPPTSRRSPATPRPTTRTARPSSTAR